MKTKRLLISTADMGIFNVQPRGALKVLVPWCPTAERSTDETCCQEALRRSISPDQTWLVGIEDARSSLADKILHDRFFAVQKPLDDVRPEEAIAILQPLLEALRLDSETEWEIHLAFGVRALALLEAGLQACSLETSRIHLAGVYGLVGTPDSNVTRWFRVSPFTELGNAEEEIHSLFAFSTPAPMSVRLRLRQQERRKALLRLSGEENAVPPDDAALLLDPLLSAFAKLRESLPAIGDDGLASPAETAKGVCDLCRTIDEQSACLETDPLGLVLIGVAKDLRQRLPKGVDGVWGWQAAMAGWCLEHHWLQQALLLAEKLVVTRLCEESQMNPLDLDRRSFYGSLLETLEKSSTPGAKAWEPLLTCRTRLANLRQKKLQNNSTEWPEDLKKKVGEAVEKFFAVNATFGKYPGIPPISIFSLQDRIPETPATPPSRSPMNVLQEARQLLLAWQDEAYAKLQTLRQEMEDLNPAQVTKVDEIIRNRKKILDLKDLAYKEGCGTFKGSWVDLIEQAKDLERSGVYRLVKILEERRQAGILVRERRSFEKERKDRGEALSSVEQKQVSPVPMRHIGQEMSDLHHPVHRSKMPSAKDLHVNDLRSLAPSSSWTLLIDETGSRFGEENSGQIGRFIGLMLPKNHGIPALVSKNGRPWHAVDCQDPQEIDLPVQQVLDSPCGVLGVTLDALPMTGGERWFDGTLALLDLVLRLLPVSGPTTITVVIEARPPFKPDTQLPAIARDSLARLGRAWPERARMINLQMQFGNKLAHPNNGHVDAIAFTWGSPSDSAKARLRQSGWKDTCLLSVDAKMLASFWDCWDLPEGLPPTDWTRLLSDRSSAVPGGLAATLLEALAGRCQNDRKCWQRYLDECRRHLDSKSVSLRDLGRQVDWLQKAMPADAVLPPRLRLVWLTTRLALANHLGQLEETWMDEMKALASRLMEEDAPLVCQAELHLAVNATNQFDFSRAAEALSRWHSVPPSVPGLRHWGQLRSSLGQHAAFAGDLPRARSFFAEALEAFARLSDPEEAQRETSQTGTYLAIAALDDSTVPRQEKLRGLVAVVGNLAQAIPFLATSDAPKDKYAHHLLLRYLVEHGTFSERQDYLARRKAWGQGDDGHPWPLILFYRACLLHPNDPAAARELVIDAREMALEASQGPTVQLIGAAIGVASLAWGGHWPEGEHSLAELETTLPLAREKIELLRQVLRSPGTDPLLLLAEVLPFNFR